MPSRDPLPPETRKRLEDRQKRAEKARHALVAKLAGLSINQLASQPVSIWTRLGPDGLVALIARNRSLAHLALAPTPVPSKPPTSTPHGGLKARIMHWRAVRPLPYVIVVALALGGGLAVPVVAGAPLAYELAMETGWLPRSVECARLDRWASDCTYTTRADGFTALEAAEYLHMPLGDLEQLDFSLLPNRPLPRGTPIQVPPRPILHRRSQ